MKPLESIFDQQSGKQEDDSTMGPIDERPLIRFSIGNSAYCVAIEHVVEVSELLAVVRYPEYAFGHEGVVNLRGNILPVLSFRGESADGKVKRCENRLIVLEFHAGKRFCARVSSPKKVSLPPSAFQGKDGILSIDGAPARIISEADFQAISEKGGAA